MSDPTSIEFGSLAVVFAWMGGGGFWSAAAVAEQLGAAEPVIAERLRQAAKAGYLEQDADSRFRLSDRGWLAAGSDIE